MSFRVAVVGGGVFGCVIGRALVEEGCKATIFDCRRPLAASRASGFLMKPSWFDGLGKAVSKPSLDLLDKLYRLQKVKFRVAAGIRTFAYRVDREQVLEDSEHLSYVERKVVRVGSGYIGFSGESDNQEYDLVVLAAGIWSAKLTDIGEMIGKKGISFEWKRQIRRSFIRPWAPYKQVVVFNVPGKDLVWGGDGTAIKAENWTEGRESQCLARVSKAAKLEASEATPHVGIRPFTGGSEPCLLEKRGKRLWLATGGGKNGTIAAGWAAVKIVEATR